MQDTQYSILLCPADINLLNSNTDT